MQFKFNSNFNKLIDFQGVMDNSEQLPIALKSLIDEGFVEVGGCWYFKRFAPEVPYLKQFHDRTGSEAFHNKIYPEDYVKKELNNEAEISLSIKFAKALAEKLNEQSSENHFIVIYSHDGDYSSVKFYKIRENEDYLLDDLEEYKLNSILVIQVSGK